MTITTNNNSYNLLYGHNMQGGGMFGDLNKFKDEEYFNSHLTGELYTISKGYTIDIFASVTFEGNDTKIFYPSNFSEEEITNILNYIKEHSLQYKDIGVTGKDKIIAYLHVVI